MLVLVFGPLWFCGIKLAVSPSFAIILLRKREPVALLQLCSDFLCDCLCLFLVSLLCGGMWSVIVYFLLIRTFFIAGTTSLDKQNI